MNVEIKQLVAGRYRLQKYAPDGTSTGDTGWFDNLILNQGLDQIGNVFNVPAAPFGNPVLFAVASVGTGSTPPTVTDTQMEAFLAAAVNDSGYVTSYVAAAGGNPAYYKCTNTYRFSAGTATGNLTEVGTGAGRSPNVGAALFSRALILDGDGNPTTLTVLSTEILDVTYEYRVYIDQTPIPFSQDINGTTYTGNWLPYHISNVPAIYRAYINGSGSFNSCGVGFASATNGTGATAGFIPTSPGYSLGSYQRTYSGTLGLSSGNYAGGLKFISISTLHSRIYINTSPFIVKTSAQQLSITFTVSWARYP